MHKDKVARRKSYVEGTINKEKLVFLVDTGAEVRLIFSSTPGLVVNDSQVSPVSVTPQLITVHGEAEVALELGGPQTQ